MSFTNINYFNLSGSQRLHDSELEVQSVLVEVLGGAQYLRSMVISPYFSDICE